ncbi:hypothetical protein SAMN06265368_2007, partial [Cohaesibacter gelatinilyticus]
DFTGVNTRMLAHYDAAMGGRQPSHLPTDVGRILHVPFKVLKYNIFGNSSVRGRKISTTPKVLPPVASFKLGEFSLHLVRRPPLHFAHEIAHRQVWWNRYEHMDMIERKCSMDDFHPVLRTNLSQNLSHTQSYIANQDLVAILGRPDQVITMVENAMFAFVVLHDHTIQKNEPLIPLGGSFFWIV